MSEGFITYQEHGNPCGVSTDINSQLRNHRVCSDGLACMYTFNSDGDSTGKQCRSVMLVEGERCNPHFDSCYGSLECLLNLNDEFTCGGVVSWDRNAPYVKEGYVRSSSFSIHLPFVITGVIILILYVLLLFYELVIVSNGIYGKKNSSTSNNVKWGPLGKLF